MVVLKHEHSVEQNALGGAFGGLLGGGHLVGGTFFVGQLVGHLVEGTAAQLR